MSSQEYSNEKASTAAGTSSFSAPSAEEQSPTDSSDNCGRKRGRSPPGEPFMLNYRPYGSGLLQAHRRNQRKPEIHKKQWDLYYHNNTVNGYKDRHYILREFHELRAAIDAAAEAAVRQHVSEEEGTGEGNSTAPCDKSFSWMEAGCGVGNAMLPVFEQYGHLPQWRALLGFDISSVAIQLLEEKRQQLSPPLAAKVHVCVLNPSESEVTDCPFFQRITASSLPGAASSPLSPEATPKGPVCADPEFVSLIFVLCSIPVPFHPQVVRRIARCMARPGGVLYFRDYAVSDHAEARFQLSSHRRRSDKSNNNSSGIEEETNTYERANGTLSHFFAVKEVRQLFVDAGFEVIALDVIQNEVTNRKKNLSFSRKFVQGRFRLIS